MSDPHSAAHSGARGHTASHLHVLFFGRCGLLNCEAVLELLLFQLGTANELEQMVRAGAMGCTTGIVRLGVGVGEPVRHLSY